MIELKTERQLDSKLVVIMGKIEKEIEMKSSIDLLF